MARSFERTLFVLSLVVMFIGSTMAHTYLSSFIIGDQALNEGDCMRAHPDQEKEYPLLSVTDQDMTCGWLPAAARPANRKCPVAAGTRVGLQWYHTQPIPSDFILADTHKGPVMVYMAKSETGAGPVWFKIYEDGYDPISQKWATDKLIANRGKVFFNIPADIAPGNYLIRGEVLALHSAYNPYGIQPYVGCVEITISGSGSATPQGVAFPGAYAITGPGMIFNVYNYYDSYTIPGPAVYRPSVTPATPAPATAAPTARPATQAPATAAPTARPATPAPATQAPATAAPTARPTSAPYTAPTERPIAPTAQPTQPAAPSTGIKLRMNPGSNSWWMGIIVQDSKVPIAKVDIMDNNALPNWTPLIDMTWAHVFSQNIQVSLPLSVRLTATNGQQIVIYNAITSWDSSNAIDTGKNF